MVLAQELAHESVANYGQSYTLEHNFSVAFTGEVAPSSSDAFWQSSALYYFSKAREFPGNKTGNQAIIK